MKEFITEIFNSLPPLTDPVEIFGVILGVIGFAIMIPMAVRLQRDFNKDRAEEKKTGCERERQ